LARNKKRLDDSPDVFVIKTQTAHWVAPYPLHGFEEEDDVLSIIGFSIRE
jgi:hypothetical protein